MNQFKELFPEPELNQLGKDIKFAKRNRDINSISLEYDSDNRISKPLIDSIADIPRGFNSLFYMEVEYKPFHKQWVKK